MTEKMNPFDERVVLNKGTDSLMPFMAEEKAGFSNHGRSVIWLFCYCGQGYGVCSMAAVSVCFNRKNRSLTEEEVPSVTYISSS